MSFFKMNISNTPRWRNLRRETKFNAKHLLFLPVLVATAVGMTGCAGHGGGTAPTNVLPFRPYYVYTANMSSNDISVFSGAQDGTLTFLRKVASPDIPHKLIVSGSTLYAACNYKLEVFSGAANGNLSLIQTVVTDSTTTDYYPSSLAFGYGNTSGNPAASLNPTKLYVLAGTGAIGASEIQSYAIASDGTITLKDALEAFTGQGALATLSYASASTDGINIIGVTNVNNTVSIVLDDGKNLTVTDNVKLSSAPVAILSSIQADIGNRFYVADQNSKNLYELNITNFFSATGPNDPKGAVIKTLSNGTTPNYLGTSVHFPTSGPIIGTPQFYTANQDINTISVYNSDRGANLPFQEVSGAQPDAGAVVTAVNAIAMPDSANKDNYYVYSTNKSGTLKFYTGNGTLTYVKEYDTQGTGVADLAITSMIGPQSSGGGTGPFVEYFNGAYLTGSPSINVSDKNQAVEVVNQGMMAGPFQLNGETSTTITATTSTGGAITSASETYVSANRYVVLVAADKFGSAIDTYAYPKNAYPSSANEWIVIFNGIPDFISGMDYYVLGPGKTLQNSSPIASNVNPGVGAFVSIPASLGKFTVVATYSGGKATTDIIATSSSQTSQGATSIIADLADVNDVYSFVFATESQKTATVNELRPAGALRAPAKVRRR
jgi:hypothetical protein